MVELAESVDGHAALAGYRLQGLTLLHLVEVNLWGKRCLGGCNGQLVVVLIGVEAAVVSVRIDTTQTGGPCRLGSIALAMVCIEIACHVLIAEVEHQGGIQGNATETCLKVQMGTRTAARVATQSDGLSGTYLLILTDELFRHVGIVGLQSIVVANHHVLAVAARFILHDAHLAAESSPNGIANIDLDIKTLVLTSPASTEIGSDHTTGRGHVEAAQVDGGGIRQDTIGVMIVGHLSIPLFVEVGSGVLKHLLEYETVESH